MKAVIQRVAQAEVRVAGEVVGTIGRGLLVLLGIATADSEVEVAALAEKTCFLRIFEDIEGKMNHSVQEVNGSVLVVSNFTVMADAQRGRRPSFEGAAPPDRAEDLYALFVRRVTALGVPVATGRFGANMQVSLVNDGPVTILLDTAR
ncbi:MAG: D-aminoacyl-tRNA deacylase [Armatimonadota bacterium]|nr:D-aminoacyl-tRNA deacylase [Armatimonadota bacterium]